MYSKTIFQNLSITVLTMLLAFSISFPAASSLNQGNSDNIGKLKEDNKDDIERITVYGQRNIFQIKKDIRVKSKEFFRSFNQLNDKNQYDVVCIKQKRKFSNLAERVCLPRYVRTDSTRLTASRIFGNDPSTLAEGGGRALARLSLASDINRLPSYHTEKFYKQVQNVLEDNPQLSEKYTELVELQNEYEETKANK